MLRSLRRKWWFWLSAGGGLFATLAVVGVYAEWKITRSRGEARLAEVVRKLDAEDPGWQAADLTAARNAALPPPERNSAAQALKAVALLPQSFKEWEKDEKWRGELRPGVLPHEDDICEAIPAYGECDEALAAARKLRHMPRGGFELVFREPNPLNTLLMNTQQLREAAGLLYLDAILLAFFERPDEAVASAHAIVNCARAIGDEPCLVSQLVRMAVTAIAKGATEQVLGMGEPTAGLAELQAAFAEEANVPRLTYGIRGERAMFFRAMENVDDGLVDLGQLTDDSRPPSERTPAGRATTIVYRKYIPGQQAAMLDLFTAMLEASKLPGPERAAAVARIPLPERRFENLMVCLLQPAWDKMMAAEDRTRALCAATAAALACERYRRKFGRWPDSLQAIPKDLLPEVPADPYTGGPLLYKVTDDGAVLYATGPDLTDDSGANLDPRGGPGTDVGFRLLNPGKRRQPAPPKADTGADPTDTFPADRDTPGGGTAPPAEREP